MKVYGAHDSDKTDVLLATEHDRAILEGEKNGRIAGTVVLLICKLVESWNKMMARFRKSNHALSKVLCQS
jgi:hypothetical protein